MTIAYMRWASLVFLLGLIVLGLAAELWLTPLRPGGSWLVLKVLPLAAAAGGVFNGRRYTYQWLSLLIWLYFTEGIVRATSDKGLASQLGWLETLLSLLLFASCAAYAKLTAPSRLSTEK